MIISDAFRLLLYILMGVIPIWADFFAKSTDYTLRGLAMPILASASAATAITLAKTSTKREATQPVEVVNPPTKPVPILETK